MPCPPSLLPPTLHSTTSLGNLSLEWNGLGIPGAMQNLADALAHNHSLTSVGAVGRRGVYMFALFLPDGARLACE